MFEFVRGQRPVLSFLLEYLDDPHWCHATDVVPMIAMTPPDAEWDAEHLRDPRVTGHLIRALNHWRAFRKHNAALVTDPKAALRRHLPRFIADIQAIPESRTCLSDIPESDIEPFADALTARLRRFGLDVKGVDSCVLPSKAAHFLLLGLVPAYDRLVIRDRTLPRLAPQAWDMRSYLLMSWWVLQQFREQGTLEEAREEVAFYMLTQQMEWTRPLPRPQCGDPILHAMDSVVAEYTLIQMGRAAEHGHLLRWAGVAV